MNIVQSFLGRSWRFKEPCPRLSLSIAQGLGLPEIIGRLLASRNIQLEDAEAFLSPTLKYFMPDPSILLDMDKGVLRIIKAIEDKETIGIWGDYDVDGATSTALLLRFFESIGVKTFPYIPDRIEEGYGLSMPGLEHLMAKGVTVLITVDCGTTSFEPIRAVQDSMDVIVIDHHGSEPALPNAYALINPNRVDESANTQTLLGHLAAVGMCFLFVVALNRALRSKPDYREPDLMGLLDLVALGTVADVVQLRTLNRAFVTQGLKVMGRRSNCGLRTLMDTAGMTVPPEAYHLGYVLGPRINAGGRVGKSSLGMELLSAHDEFHAQKIAAQLEAHNAERKTLEDIVLEQALAQAESMEDDDLLVLSSDGWHVGVIGIVAGRIKERFQKPTCVIGFEGDIGKASCRSIYGLDLGALVHSAKQMGHLVAGGGHPMAAGFTVEKSKLEGLRQFLRSKTQHLKPLILESRTLILEGNLALASINLELMAKIKRVGPFGSGNPSPRFSVGPVQVAHITPMGSDHIRCTLKQMDGSSLEGVAFRCLNTELGLGLLHSKGRQIYVAGTLSINTWQGRDKIQITIDDGAWGE